MSSRNSRPRPDHRIGAAVCHVPTILIAALCASILLTPGCRPGAPSTCADSGSAYDWQLPDETDDGIQPPPVPPGNCMNAERVDLGRHLFYDRRLSGNGTMSCASCHRQALAFTDGRSVARGLFGESHPRNAQSLTNVAYFARLTWANSLMSNLEIQSRVPLTSESGPGTIVELGYRDETLPELARDPSYARKFQAAYGVAGQEIQLTHVQRALASFERTLLSFDSDYDRYRRGAGAISAAAVRGEAVFRGDAAGCVRCHGDLNFSNAAYTARERAPEVAYRNNGLYSSDDYARFPAGSRGLVDVTGLEADAGRFRVPSLRNLAYTSPYMHDGSIDCDKDATKKRGQDGPDGDPARAACARDALRKVVEHYMRGGKVDRNGQVHPTVDRALIRPFRLNEQEQSDLVEFLMSLNDPRFVRDPRFANPRPEDANFGP